MTINNDELVKISTSVSAIHKPSELGFNLLYIDQYKNTSDNTVTELYNSQKELDKASILKTKDLYKVIGRYYNLSVKPSFIYAMHVKSGTNIGTALGALSKTVKFYVVVLSNTVKAIANAIEQTADYCATNDKLFILDYNEYYDKTGGKFLALGGNGGDGGSVVGIYRRSSSAIDVDFALGCLIVGSKYGEINPFIVPNFNGIAADDLTDADITSLTNANNFLARYDKRTNGVAGLQGIRLIKDTNNAKSSNLARVIKFWYTKAYIEAKTADKLVERKPSINPENYMSTVSEILQPIIKDIIYNNYAQKPLNDRAIITIISLDEIVKYRKDNSNKYPPVEINLLINEEPASIAININI